ncbi:MAG: SpoIIE family protein phosphatase [Methanospirillum sp.]|uniref:PP2C family protein-serine/threonine phosphatase n=1 Tax=Methanospirillum sp. TaxID=45200 RepID=UPI002375F479|nr:SpoIIE family protein phosphatase [Methanospirillum sp.]MDD1727973.1 SpoIIE family protein phosphatase [Methanospirillum sp.]
MFVETYVIGDLLEKMATVCFAAYLLTRTKWALHFFSRERSWQYLASISLIFGAFYAFGYFAGSGTATDYLSTCRIGPNMAGLLAGPVGGVGAAGVGLILQAMGSGPVPLATITTELMDGIVCGIAYLLNKRRLIGVWQAGLLGLVLTGADSVIALILTPGITQPRILIFNVVSIEILVIGVGMALFTLLMHNVSRERERTSTASRLEGQVLAAREIQQGYLPATIPAMKNLTIAARLIPMHEVGGDFYDIREIAPNRLFFCIGDVAGKGISAAFVMASSLTLIRNALMYSEQPAEILSQVNQGLIRSSNDTLFVTLLAGVMNTETGTVSYANAGHNPPFIFNKETAEIIPMNSDIPLGSWEEYSYRQDTFVLKPGDYLVLYTDGVTECENESGVMLGTDAVLKEFSCSLPPGSDAIAETVTRIVFDHAGSSVPGDDVTVMIIGRDA